MDERNLKSWYDFYAMPVALLVMGSAGNDPVRT
jgi:hypothetical protein